MLRGGLDFLPVNLPYNDYCVIVIRPEDRTQVDFLPIGLFDPLPIIPIPLRSPDPEANLDLKAVLDFVYVSACYED